MAPGTPIRAAALAVLVSCLMAGALAWVPALDGAAAAERMAETQSQIVIAASDSGSRSLPLGIGKTVVIDFPRDIKDVLVGDPKIANAIIRSSRRAYIIGVASGATNIFFFDASGKQIVGFDVSIARDVNIIREAIRRLIPDSDINVEGIGDGIMLTGTVATPAEAQQAYDIATRFVGTSESGANSSGGGGSGGSGGGSSMSMSLSVGGGGGGSSSASKIINAIVVRGRDQIMLKVTVAEVERDLIKQLGINLSGSLGYGLSLIHI